jgi:hypothetical protein
VAAVIGALVAVNAGGAALRADGADVDHRLVDAVQGQVAIEQPRVEHVGFESDHGLHRVMLRGLNGMPPEIGADIDEDAAMRRREVVGHPLRQRLLMGAVFGKVSAQKVAPLHKERQLRLLGSDAERRTPRHQPGQQECERSKRAGNAFHARPEMSDE